MKRLLFFFFVWVHITCAGQTAKYWIYYSATDLRSQVTDSLVAWETHESYYSTLLNASSAPLTTLQVDCLRKHFPQLQFQKGKYLQYNQVDQPKAELNFALEQIHAEAMVDAGYTAKGVKIGIIDGGFLYAPKAPKLAHFFKKKQIAAYKDFITPKLKPYGGNSNLDDQHGTEVWEMVGGYHAEKDIQHGLATEATYYLARTDHGAGEKRIEEEYFIKALEWMARKGIRLVNTSLGYTNGYDDPKEDYKPTQMNGTTAIAMACQKAIEKYDMIIVGAAGNEGNLPWKVINTPADAKGVIAVGASKVKLLDKMSYSSIGPDFLDYLKPELTCYSSGGTSFAAPVITGLVACMLQANPQLSHEEVRHLLITSCNLYPYGNNYVGYGVPDARQILASLQNKNNSTLSAVRRVKIKARSPLMERLLPPRKFRTKVGSEAVVVYHKYEEWKVSSKKVILPSRKKIVIKRPENTEQTTVVVGEQIYEVFWETR